MAAVSIEVRRLRRDEWAAWRALRLRALREAPPYAFSSTYEAQSALPDDFWRQRTAVLADSTEQAMFVVEDGDALLGCVGVARETDDTASAISMWVSPEARGRGLGLALLDAAVDHWRRAGGRVLRLEVTDGNAEARGLYRRFGFRDTGRATPFERDPELVEREMELRLQ